ncbi:hypothetical protein J2045_003366 [Peteryoungia aggregata LMG 23059]|uniref:Uncharacterized protein n=1 Tax=Peteryoungia aggregata LMG 23059 TaxID=1368425 RepID=A0ABU0GB39_9HYPH|nr:hypothetical protein [Peteryoungia aggregata]MDQ0422318.1 hypothetical protein [Peteryoungia aggregata LMG 23059]
MRDERLKQLLVYNKELSTRARLVPGADDMQQWVFRPAGRYRNRLFFVWISDTREVGGTRCRDDHTDPTEPWKWHAYLPKKFLRVMLDLAPQEEVAEAIAKTLIN